MKIVLNQYQNISLIRVTYGYCWAKFQRARTKNSEISLGDLWNCFWRYGVLIIVITVWWHPYPYSTPQELSNDMLHLIFCHIYEPFLIENRKIKSTYMTILEVEGFLPLQTRRCVTSIIATGTLSICMLRVWVRISWFSCGKRHSITFLLRYNHITAGNLRNNTKWSLS